MTASSFPAEDIQSAAQSASYKIFYLISEKSNVLSMRNCKQLARGIESALAARTTQDPDKLEEAYDAFRAARTERVDFYEAYLLKASPWTFCRNTMRRSNVRIS